MTPEETAKAIRSISEYLLNCKNPDKTRVSTELHKIRDALIPRHSARVDKFTRREYEAAVGGIQSLFDKFMRAAKTMNPQDPNRSDLESESAKLLQLKSELADSYKKISKLEI